MVLRITNLKLTDALLMNINELMNTYKDFFYVLVDSGNIGSKMNAYHFANSIGIDTVEKYYIGNLENLTILM